LAFQLNDVAVSLASGMSPMMVAMQQGSQISQLYAGQGGVAMAFKQTGLMAQGAAMGILRMAAAHPVAAAAAVGLGLGLSSIVGDLQAAGHEAIGFGDVIVAAMQVAASGVYQFFRPAIDTIAPAVSAGFSAAVQVVKFAGNTIIQTAVGIGTGVVGAFAAAKDGIIAAWRVIPGALGDLMYSGANLVIGGVEQMINGVTSRVDVFIAKVNSALAMLPEWATQGAAIGTIGEVSLPRVNNPFAGQSSGSATSVRDAFTSRLSQADSDMASALSRDYLGDFGDAIKAKAIANSLAEVEAAAGGAGRAIKKAATDAKDPWDGLRTQSDAAREAMEKMKAQQEAMATASKQLGTDLGGVFKGLVEGTTDWKDAALSAFKAVMQFANAQNLAGGGRGLFGGGFFQLLIGGLIGIPGFANGTGAAPGGLALVGERGPELVNLPRGSQVIPNHKMNAANGNTVNMPITINAPGADAAALARVEREVQQLGRSIPKMIDSRNATARSRGVRG
jgi:hypothetical protein